MPDDGDGRTLFERIIDRDIPADIIYEDDRCVAFRDVDPQAPTHVLVVPRKVVPTLNDLAADDEPLVGHLFTVAAKVMAGAGHRDYRCVINCGEQAGQSVFHLHLHVMAGRPMAWPPG